MVDKFNSTSRNPSDITDAKSLGAGGDDKLDIEEVGTQVQVDLPPDQIENSVEIIEDGSAIVGEEELTVASGFNSNLAEILDEEIARVVNDYGPNEVVLKKEIAPGQTMEYYVKMSEDEGTLLNLTPLGDADRAENATIIIEETNPQKVKMYTITFDPSKLEEPMYMFKKKDGGTIAKDSLVSITDIYGEYGR